MTAAKSMRCGTPIGSKKQQGFPDPAAADLIYFINKLASHSLGHLLDGPLWEGTPAKRVGERALNLVVAYLFVSPSVRFADSSLAEGAF